MVYSSIIGEDLIEGDVATGCQGAWQHRQSIHGSIHSRRKVVAS